MYNSYAHASSSYDQKSKTRMGTDDESSPLVGSRNGQRIKNLCPKKQTCLVTSLVLFPLFLCAFIVSITVSVSEYKYCENARGSSADHKYSRSGSNVLLTKTNIEDFTCVLPIANAHLSGEASVTIYETFCKDLHTKKASVDRKSLPYKNVIRPIVVLSEDFDENYFLKGMIDVVVNATFNASLSETDIYVCLFVDYEVFTDFTNSDKNWRMYIKNGTCRRTFEEQFKTTFNVTKPDYVFIAIATTNALDMLQFGYNGTRYDYDIPTFTNMTKLCSLRSDKPETSICTFSIRDTGDDLCLLASNGENADSSYYYSTITLNFPYTKQRTVIGAALTVLALFFLVIIIILIVSTLILALRLRRL